MVTNIREEACWPHSLFSFFSSKKMEICLLGFLFFRSPLFTLRLLKAAKSGQVRQSAAKLQAKEEEELAQGMPS